jgi:hypothetical protein
MDRRCALLGTPLLLVGLACATQLGAPDVPLPDFVRDVRRTVHSAERYEVSFVPRIPNDLDDIRGFYGEWTEAQGWRKVLPDEEAWSIDAWQSFSIEDHTSVRQFLVHWVDPSGAWSLRLAMRYYGEFRHRAEAFIVVERYENLDELELESPAGQPVASADAALGASVPVVDCRGELLDQAM